MTSTKRVRFKCARCGKIKYLELVSTDFSEPFLCAPCDDKFILWQESKYRAAGPGEHSRVDDTLARFLQQRPIRRKELRDGTGSLLKTEG